MQYTRNKSVLPIALPLIMAAAIAQSYELEWHTVDGGGALFTTDGSPGGFELAGTIGQGDAGEMSGGTFTLTGGFWFAVVPGDCNVDGGVTLLDYAAFEACLSGPGGGLIDPGCPCFDLDGSGDVDLADFAIFQQSFTGS